jgi:hypothetical protein
MKVHIENVERIAGQSWDCVHLCCTSAGLGAGERAIALHLELFKHTNSLCSFKTALCTLFGALYSIKKQNNTVIKSMQFGIR